MFGDLFTYGCNNISELSPAFQRKICEFIGKRRMIPVKMYEGIVKDCVPSEGMRKAMAEEMLSKEHFFSLIQYLIHHVLKKIIGHRMSGNSKVQKWFASMEITSSRIHGTR